MPVFDEVYNETKKQSPSIGNNVNLYVIDTITINACSLGKNTIALTRGIIETMSKEQLKAVIAHEFGHLVHKHTQVLIIILIWNSIFSIAVKILKFILRFIEAVSSAFRFGIWIGFIAEILIFSVNILCVILELAVWGYTQISGILLGANSRKNEYIADEYAYKLGYSNEMISVLYELQDININQKLSLIERLKSTHPYTSERIKRLEEL